MLEHTCKKNLKKKNYESPVISIGERFTRPFQPSFRKAIDEKQHSRCTSSVHLAGGGFFPYKRLIGMCRWIGLHFHDWIDYNGVTFSIELLEWGPTFSDIWG